MDHMINGIASVSTSGVLAGSVAPLWHFFGVFHPVVVHFPIALLTVAGIIEGFNLLPWRKKARQEPAPGNAAYICLCLGAAGAIVATLLGWANSDAAGGFNGAKADVELVHRWTGVTVAVLAVIMAAVATMLRRGYAGRRLPWGYRGGVLLTAALVGLAGSYGGKLTHGIHYYNEAFETMVAELNAPAKPAGPSFAQTREPAGVTPAAEQTSADSTQHSTGAGQAATSTATAPSTQPATPAVQTGVIAAAAAPWGGGRIRYEEDVKPIFQANCVKCHSEDKQKGNYRLDTRDFALRPGESGTVPIVPGRAADSLLVKVIEGKGEFAEDRMPPKGNVLTPEQIALIRRWIDEGASTATP